MSNAICDCGHAYSWHKSTKDQTALPCWSPSDEITDEYCGCGDFADRSIEVAPTASVVGRVGPSAESIRATNPHVAPERRCPTCGGRPPAGMVRCPERECRGEWTP